MNLTGGDKPELVVVPPEQGLRTCHLPRGQDMVRLIRQDIFAVPQSVGKTPLHEYEFRYAYIHIGSIELIAVPAQVLGFRERSVRVLHEQARVFAVRGIDRYSDRQGHRDFLAPRHDDLRHVLHDHLHEKDNVRGPFDVMERDPEFVAAEAADNVAFVDGNRKAFRHLFQNLVARLEAVDFVQILEAVNVDCEHGNRLFLPLPSAERSRSSLSANRPRFGSPVMAS